MVSRPLLRNYTCECFVTSFYGRHCELVAKMSATRQIISKLLGYFSCTFLVSVVLFIMVTDILQYGFGIDPAKVQREKAQHERVQGARLVQRNKQQPKIQKFAYVDQPMPRERTGSDGNDKRHEFLETPRYCKSLFNQPCFIYLCQSVACCCL